MYTIVLKKIPVPIIKPPTTKQKPHNPSTINGRRPKDLSQTKLKPENVGVGDTKKYLQALRFTPKRLKEIAKLIKRKR